MEVKCSEVFWEREVGGSEGFWLPRIQWRAGRAPKAVVGGVGDEERGMGRRNGESTELKLFGGKII